MKILTEEIGTLASDTAKTNGWEIGFNIRSWIDPVSNEHHIQVHVVNGLLSIPFNLTVDRKVKIDTQIFYNDFLLQAIFYFIGKSDMKFRSSFPSFLECKGILETKFNFPDDKSSAN